MMNRLSIGMAAGCMLLLTGCGQQKPHLPASTPQPSQVIVVGDVDSLLYRELSIPVAGLPQPEPMFDVESVGWAGFKGKTRLRRNLMLVRLDRKWKGEPSVRCLTDRYARGQLVVRIDARLAKELRQFVIAHSLMIRQLFMAHEYALAVRQLERRHSARARQLIDSMFHQTMLLPPGMNAYKTGKDFLWVSDNAAQGMQNLCIYTLDGLGEPSAGRMDSVLRVNMKGETDRMYMRMVAQTVHDETFNYQGVTCHLQCGLWEMAGDAMGGPLVRRMVQDSTAGKTLVMDAFVYAPESRKRDKLRVMEAALLASKRK